MLGCSQPRLTSRRTLTIFARINTTRFWQSSKIKAIAIACRRPKLPAVSTRSEGSRIPMTTKSYVFYSSLLNRGQCLDTPKLELSIIFQDEDDSDEVDEENSDDDDDDDDDFNNGICIWVVQSLNFSFTDPD